MSVCLYKAPGSRQTHGRYTLHLLQSLGVIRLALAGRAGRADSLSTLANVLTNVVVTTVVLSIEASLVLWASLALKVNSLVWLAGGRVDVAAFAEGDLAVVA